MTFFDLTDLAALKEQLGKTNASDTDDDALLGKFITRMSAQIEKYLGRKIETFTFLDPDGIEDGTVGRFADVFWPKGGPITGVNSLIVHSSRAFTDGTPLVENTDFLVVHDGMGIQLLWEQKFEPAYWQLKYDGGLAPDLATTTDGTELRTAFPDIEQACILQCIHLWRRRDKPIGDTNTSRGGSITFPNAYGFIEPVMELLQPYKREVE